MARSYNMLVVLAMLNEDAFPARSRSTPWPKRREPKR